MSRKLDDTRALHSMSISRAVKKVYDNKKKKEKRRRNDGKTIGLMYHYHATKNIQGNKRNLTCGLPHQSTKEAKNSYLGLLIRGWNLYIYIYICRVR